LSGVLCALGILGATGVLSWLLMRPATRLGLRLGLVDLPSTRRTRARPIPTTGGLVIFGTTVAALLVAVRYCGHFEPEVAAKLAALIAGGAVIVILGMLDDRLNLRPRLKLVVQIAVAVAMVYAGVGIERMRFLVGPTYELGWLKYPVTVFWFVGFMNAVNLVDGLDGLASGIAAIGAGALFIVGVFNENVLLYMMAAALLGSTLGFLLHNFREGNIYLGDAGSMVLGFFLAGGAVVGAYGDGASNALLVGGACMAVPAFDVATTIVRRGRAHSGVMTPDRSHVHHRLIRFGLNPKMAVIVLWGITLFFAGQMLGFVTPHGLAYLLASYVVAAVVANIIVEQRRKNMKTMESDFKEELLYLIGATGAKGIGSADGEEMTLREIIVAQIRREAKYRRLARAEAADASSESKVPVGAPPDAPAAARGSQRPVFNEEHGLDDHLIMDDEEAELDL
jgi:UDP-GlcNAc:undecaprenyl-phosphate GlcNAc-1-phosphate transferase